MQSKDTRLQRYRTGGYGAMVESEGGPWVRADDVVELLKTLHGFADHQDKPLVAHLIDVVEAA